MILWIIGIVAFLLGIGLMLIYNNTATDEWCFNLAVTLFAFGLGIIIVGAVGYASIDYNGVQKEYAELVELLPVMEASNNESLRYMYFQRVQEYNEGYDFAQEYKDKWYCCWGPYQPDIYDGCKRIEFKLRSGAEPTDNNEEPQEVTE